jgi:hypothetical protein
MSSYRWTPIVYKPVQYCKSWEPLVVPNWPKLAQIGPNWPKLAQIGPNWPKLAQIGLEPSHLCNIKLVGILWGSNGFSILLLKYLCFNVLDFRSITLDRVRVVGAHFVTIRLVLNETYSFYLLTVAL